MPRGNPYRHPDTGKMISKKEYLAIMANQPAKPKHDPRLPKRYTDEGIAEREAKLDAEGRLNHGPRVEFIRDEHDQKLAAREAACEGKLNAWEAPDPLKELETTYGGDPSKRYRFIDKDHKRGRRGWEFVRQPGTGSLVEYGKSLALAEMPEEKVAQRNRYYRDKGAVDLESIEAANAEAMERMGAGAYNSGAIGRDTIMRDRPDRRMGISMSKGAEPGDPGAPPE